jgi:hypothetical protein
MTHDDRGIALLLAVLATLVVSALTSALVLTTTTESLTGSAYGASQQALYAAESTIEWTAADLSGSGADWAAVAAGMTASTFVDGEGSGLRALADGSSLDLGAVTAANPGWHVYAYGRLDDLLPDFNRVSACYVVALVAPDPVVAGAVKIRALSFGRRGAHQALEARAVRIGASVALEAWRR